MNKFKKGDKVIINESITPIQGVISSIANGGFFSETLYNVVDYNGRMHSLVREFNLILIEEEEGKKKMSNEEKELKKDIEILLNIYLSDRPMTNKEIKRFSERHFDIIEKQNAKNTLKKRSK